MFIFSSIHIRRWPVVSFLPIPVGPNRPINRAAFPVPPYVVVLVRSFPYLQSSPVPGPSRTLIAAVLRRKEWGLRSYPCTRRRHQETPLCAPPCLQPWPAPHQRAPERTAASSTCSWHRPTVDWEGPLTPRTCPLASVGRFGKWDVDFKLTFEGFSLQLFKSIFDQRFEIPCLELNYSIQKFKFL